MYFARILFFCEKGLQFNNLSPVPIELFQTDNYKCTIKSKIQGNKIKVIIEYGGFEKKEKAQSEGINLLRNIKLEMCKYNNSINISGIKGMLDCKELSVMPAELTPHGINYCREKLMAEGKISKNTRVMEDVLGLEIYEVTSSMNEIYFVAEDFKLLYNTDFKFQKQNFEFWDDKLDTALSFLNTSILINDVRIKFLLKIMCIEVLVSNKKYNEDSYIAIIDNITKSLSSNDELNKRLKNDISQLKVQSIGSKCRNLITKHCKGINYSGLNALDFFKYCYKMRSNLVHSGEIDLLDLKKHDEPLRKLVTDIIESISRNKN